MLVGWNKSIRDDCLNAASGYFSGRKDNVVVSFGKTGKNIVSRFPLRRVSGTGLLSVMSGETDRHGPIMSVAARKMLHSYSSEIDRVEYYRNLGKNTGGNSVSLDIVPDEEFMGTVNVDEEEFNERPEATAERLLSSACSSSSFILVSDFGESFSRRMHIQFSRLLTSKGIPHLNIITIPRKARMSCMEMATSAIDELRGTGARVITYLEEKFLNKPGIRSKSEFQQMLAGKVNEFSRRLAASANLLKIQMLVS